MAKEFARRFRATDETLLRGCGTCAASGRLEVPGIQGGGSVAGGRTRNGGIQLIWAGTIIIDLFAVLAIVQGAKEDSLLVGRTGTTALLAVVVVLAVVSAVCAWRGVTGSARVVLAAGQFVAAVLVIVVMFGFFGGDGTKASSVTPLLLYCAFAEAMIGVGVWQSARQADSFGKGR